jgi:hypothetical protein
MILRFNSVNNVTQAFPVVKSNSIVLLEVLAEKFGKFRLKSTPIFLVETKPNLSGCTLRQQLNA